MASFNHPKSWSPEEVAFVGFFKSAAGDPPADLVAFRNAMGAAPPPPLPENVTLKEVEIPRLPVAGLEDAASGTFRAEWHEPKEVKTDHVLIYAHGGAYVIMSPASHRGITGGIASHGVRVLSIDCGLLVLVSLHLPVPTQLIPFHHRIADRMAPEDPYPAAVVDAISAIKYVISQGTPANKIFLAGDSAGGGLTVATAMYLRDHPEVAPNVAGIAPISPWIDLTGSSPTIVLGDEFDACILRQGKEGLGRMVDAYAGKGGDAVKKATYFSPIFDTSSAPLPPTLCSLATVDRLFGEDLAFYMSRPEAVQVDIYQDQFHVFQFFGALAQSQTCFTRIADFVKSDPAALKGSINWITYDGKAAPLADGKAKMKEHLADYVKRAAALPGFAVEAVYEKALK